MYDWRKSFWVQVNVVIKTLFNRNNETTSILIHIITYLNILPVKRLRFMIQFFWNKIQSFILV